MYESREALTDLFVEASVEVARFFPALLSLLHSKVGENVLLLDYSSLRFL